MIVPGSANPLLASTDAGGYTLSKSLRFRSSASAYFNRTPASASNRKTWTWSGWVKKSVSGSSNRQTLFAAETGSSDSTWLEFGFQSSGFSADAFYVTTYSAQTYSSAVYRDPSAWYHVVVAFDTTQSTSSNRIKVYINGSQISLPNGSFVPTLNGDYGINNTQQHALMAIPGGGQYLDGYLTETNFIDGQALTPSSFGETDSVTGVWKPKAYSGTYGTNGFYLKFTDTTSTSTLGNDSSGNSNTWTVNNISLTSGATYDSMTDVPTLTSATAANYCVMNPLNNGGTLSNGNLQFTQGASHALAKSTFAVPTTGLWYAESIVSTLTSGSVAAGFGLGTAALSLTATASTASGAWVLYGSDQTYFNRNSTQTSIVGTFAANDVLQIAIDLANSRAWVGKNNTWYDGSNGTTGNPATGSNPTFTSLSSELFVICNAYSNTVNVNFGQRPFAYTPPSGFVALNTFNLPTPTIGATASTQANDYFDVLTWTGDNSTANATKNRTGLGFQPDFVWIKNRSNAYSHNIYDAVRGAGSSKDLQSDNTNSESTNSSNAALYGFVSAFNSDGFQTTNGTDASSGGIWVNQSSQTYVAWNWKANGAGSSNTAGSISSTVSANTTAGFSIVTYTGNGTNSTIGHGLGVAPSFIIAKARNSAQRWTVYTGALGNGYYGYLNETFAFDTGNASQRWNTSPTSSVFGVGTSVDVNNNTTTYVAYCFAEVAGYSKFGSYTGNGSADGTFVYTGFRPAFVIIKRTDSTGNWGMIDNKRSGYNEKSDLLYPNGSFAEDSGSTYPTDILSNGFKHRNTSFNASGGTYIYMAFAENPFKYANAR